MKSLPVGTARGVYVFHIVDSDMNTPDRRFQSNLYPLNTKDETLKQKEFNKELNNRAKLPMYKLYILRWYASLNDLTL